MPRAKSAQEVQNRFLEAARKGEIDSRVAEAVERLNKLFEKIYTNGAASPSVKTVSEEFANLDTWTAGMENLVDEGSKESVAEHANVTLSNLHSSLMEALESESPEEGKNCYQWLIDEAEKDGIDFVEDMKTLDSITGLGWELEEPEIEEEKDEEEKVEEQPQQPEDEIANLGMDQVAADLYAEIGYLVTPMTDAYGSKWGEEAEDASHYFVEYTGSAEFKKNFGLAQEFLNKELPDGKTVAEFAREKNLLGDKFNRLMKRAGEIAATELQEEPVEVKKASDYEAEFDKMYVDPPQEQQEQPQEEALEQDAYYDPALWADGPDSRFFLENMERMETLRENAQRAYEENDGQWGDRLKRTQKQALCHMIGKIEERAGLTESAGGRVTELESLPGYDQLSPKAVMDMLGDEKGLYSPDRIRLNFYQTLEIDPPVETLENGDDFQREAEEEDEQNVKEEDKKEVQQQGGDDLTEEDRIKADKRKTAGRLYTKIREMNDRIFDYGLPAQTKLRDVLYNLASYSGDEEYAAAIRQAKKFLTEKIPGSKDTYGDVAEERGILDDDFDELMKHAEQLAAVKTQKKKEPEKQAEKKEPKKEAPKKQAQEQKKAPAPEVDEDDKEYDAQEYLFRKMNKYLVDVRGSALKLATNSDDEAARQEYKHNLSRILAFRNEREDWKKHKVLTGADVNNINLKVEQDASLMEESLKFNDIIDGMSGTELFDLVGEMDKLGVNSTTKHPDKIAEGFAKADEAYEVSRKEVSNLAPQIEATKSSPLYSKLKSWFVGNSDEYGAALKALKDFGGGKGGKQEAIDSVKQYLNLRGSKVRNTQFGRDRFDGMMKSLATLMNPEEFAKYCKEVDGARLERDKSYKGVINPYNYLSPEQQKAHDQACLEADKNNKELKFRRDEIIEGFKKINVKKIEQSELQNWTEFATEHPSFRKEMQDIFKEKGVKLNLPKAPEEPAREMGGNQPEADKVKEQGGQLGK